MTTILNEVKLDFQDVLLMPKRSTVDSRAKVVLERPFVFRHSPIKYEGVPILTANMDHTGTYEMAEALAPYKLGVALHKFYTLQSLLEYFKRDQRNEYVFYTTGISDQDKEKFHALMKNLPKEKRPKYICIDVANGYSRKFVAYVEMVRKTYPDVCIMAGNVVTGDMVYDLLERGADIVKVGIGGGSVCLTRKLTGVGYPQLSVVMECQDAAHGAGGLICSDGGVTCPGDVVKAFAGGADFVMCGGLFAGHIECTGEIINGVIDDDMVNTIYDESFGNPSFDFNKTILRFQKHRVTSEKRVTVFDDTGNNIIKDDPIPLSFYKNPETLKMRFYGMASKDALDKYYGGKAEYRATEGKTVEVPFKGPVKTTVEEILGGLRSGCTYVGAKRLKDLPKCATFVKVGQQLNSMFGD